MKQCKKCGQEKPDNEFRSHPTTKDGLQSWCKVCTQEAVDVWRLRDPEKTYDYYLRRKYGITFSEYICLLESQGGCCAICGDSAPLKGKRFLNVDHDHETGAVRGILCQRCNTGIGKLRDSVEMLDKAKAYLQNPPMNQLIKS